MEFPLWAAFGLTSAALSAIMMLAQEKLKVEGFALAFWNKVGCFCIMLPFAIYFGFPHQWQFYALVAAQAVLWVISDVLFFRAIPKVGAGVVSRILPISVIFTFFLWFLFDPALAKTYMETPWKSLGVVACLFLSVYCAMRLRHCAVSWQAVRLLWFVIFAAIIGPIGFKLITQHVEIAKGPFTFVVFEAAVMIFLWLLWYALAKTKPVERAVMLSAHAIKSGFLIASVSSFMVASNFMAIAYVDNPGLLPAVKFLDAFLILVVYRVVGKKEDADIWAGLGIVFCAVMIVVLKSVQ